MTETFKSFSEFVEKRRKILLEEKTPPKDSSINEETWKKWKQLVNMKASEFKSFFDSEDAKDAGMKQKDADKAGIDSGKESAKKLLLMIPSGTSFKLASQTWTPDMWKWARKQISFISRMKGMRKRIKGNPFEDESGNMTRWLKSLLIWGHDPRK